MENPTRGANILDLVLTNCPQMIHSCSVLNPGLSDHNKVTVSLLLPERVRDTEEQFLKFELQLAEDCLGSTVGGHSRRLQGK